MKKLLVLLFIIPAGIQAQSVSYAPTSLEFWGETKSTSVYSFEYDMFGVHYFNIRKSHIDELGDITVDQSFALSVKPVNIHQVFKLGVIVFDQMFPTKNGRRANVWVEAGVDIYMFRLSYIHISNAYTGRLNHGIDFIRLSLEL